MNSNDQPKSSFFFPTRIDAITLLIVFICLTALGINELTERLMSLNGPWPFRGELRNFRPVLFLVLGCVIAIAVTWGWKRLRWIDGISVLMWAVIGLLLYYFSILQFTAFSGTHRFTSWYSGGNLPTTVPEIRSSSTYPFDSFESSMSFWTTAITILSIGFFTTFFITRLFCYAIDGSKFFLKRAGSRLRLLVAVAIVLFVSSCFQRVFFPEGFVSVKSVFKIIQNWKVEWWIAIVRCICIAALIATPMLIFRFASKEHWLKWALIALFPLPILIQGERFFEWCVLFLSLQIGLVWTTLVVARLSNAASEVPAKLSIVSWAGIALTVFALAGVYFFDIDTLWHSKSDGRIALAAKVKQIGRKSDYQIRPITTTEFACSFDKDTPKEIFNALDNEQPAALTIAGLRPEIDVLRLNGKVDQLRIEQSKCNLHQLKALMTSCRRVELNDVEIYAVEPVVPSLYLDNLESLEVSRYFGTDVSNLVNSIATTGPLSILEVSSPKHSMFSQPLSDFASKHCPVHLNYWAARELAQLEDDKDASWSGLLVDLDTCFMSSNSVRGDEYIEGNLLWQVITREIGAAFDLEEDHPLFWDLVFTKGRNAYPIFDQKVLKALDLSGPFTDAARKFHWSFAEDKNGQPTGFFLPRGETAFGRLANDELEFDKIETLSFDPFWLTGKDPRPDSIQIQELNREGVIINVDFFSKLSNLKRLDGRSNSSFHADLINHLPSIEHLQARFEPGSLVNANWSACPNLKSLILFGTPSTTEAEQLMGHPSLKSILIVEKELTASDESQRQKLTTILAPVKVEFRTATEYTPRPPLSFVAHVNGLRNEVFSKYKYLKYYVKAKGPQQNSNRVQSLSKEKDGEFSGLVNQVKYGIRTRFKDGYYEVYEFEGGLPGDGWDGSKINSYSLRPGRLPYTQTGFSQVIKVFDNFIRIGDGQRNEIARLDRVVRKSPTEGKNPPSDAIILFDGSGVKHWQYGDDDGWMTPEGLLTEGNVTKQKFKSHRLHLEYLQQGETTISFEHGYRINLPPWFGDRKECGALNNRDAEIPMCYPSGQWQTLDVEFRTPEIANTDSNNVGTTTTTTSENNLPPSIINVKLNGVTIHKNAQFKTKISMATEGGRISLKESNNPIRFRNIWIQPLESLEK